jgi:hypothetical protein
MAETKLKINRAPVMTLWAAVVAERLGYDDDAALTLGRAVAGLNAQSKGRRLGIYEEPEDKEGDQERKTPSKRAEERDAVPLLGRAVPVRKTKEGLRATSKGELIEPESVRRYLKNKFGDHLTATRAAMKELADAYPPRQLAGQAYDLYEQFRPDIPEGKKGWGAAGTLDLDQIRALGEAEKT